MKSKNLVKESNTESNITMHIVPEEIKLDNTIRTTNFNRETIKYFSDLLDNAGVESWELFWVLLETWEGDFKSLLELTTNMK
jgi:hypothetical protein